MGIFSFLSKKKGSEPEPFDPNTGVPVPSSLEKPDIYADLPAFSEKATGEELLPPLKPLLHDASVAGIREESPIPMPSDEGLPTPPDFNGFGEEDISPTQPYSIPSIQQEPQVPAPEAVPEIPEPPAEPAPVELPEPPMATERVVPGPYIRAYELRQVFKDVADLHASIKIAQDIALIKELLAADSSAYERFHKSIETLQRKLMLAERMFMKV
jgi:hypothetical protein